ncbi:urea-proton symporter DUR3 [Eurytemora carolleeae]|uniref:urea-proton symporter DUR3 n=1 Tax=Eurytemora carolleeae TaxID=1294199 RepID=UPI000C7639AF|nr:urea-proton symporter DUR3 [Eurytemora carolleeae]|eukprot:XP_023321844.1 urea-proton symporter DUR3-like [Eurytemora affinis]
MWSRTTGVGVSLGCVLGAVCSISCWLIHASTYPGGLSDFIANTGRGLPMLTGNVIAIIAGGVICSTVSFFTSTPETDQVDWNETRDIDNPLKPWTQIYKTELNLKPTGRYHDRPSLETFEEVYGQEKRIAWILGGGISFIMVFVWPLLMLESVVQDQLRFLVWTGVSQAWTFGATFYIIVVPFVEEVIEVYGQYKKKKEENRAGVITPFIN